jgi:UDP-3-O-[3-hydroxymyristoyl] glucosamine N-acyltransferase
MKLSLTIDQVASLTEAASIEGEAESRTRVLMGIAALADASAEDLSFLANPRYVDELAASRAGAVLVAVDHPGKPLAGQVYIRVAKPSYALALVCASIEARLWPRPAAGIHPTAWIDPKARVDATATIGPGCTILADAVIGAHAVIDAQCHIGVGARIGSESWLKPRATVSDYCIVGSRCRLQSGVVVGSDGFGYEPVGERIERIPQIGFVELEDDVEVGANTTLDRARFSRTVVGRGTKIDNLVQIAHNVRIGRQCLIAAQVGVAGSTVMGDGCVLGGQAGVSGHLQLGDRVKLGAQTGLFEDVPADGFMNGTPAMPFGLERRVVVLARRLPELFKKVDSLAAALDSVGKSAP